MRIWNNPKGGELNPAVDIRRRCKKNLLLFYSAPIRAQKKIVTVAAKLEKFRADEARKGQFL